MKLIDILVQELPKRGGWPDGCHAITQDSDKAINEYSSLDGVEINEHGTWRAVKSWNDYCVRAVDAPCLAEDYHTAIITREQYDAALAAKNDGWIDWPDNRMFAPVHSSTLVDVMYGDGEKAHGVSAGNVVWENGKMPDEHQEVIAYRLHKPQEVTEPDAESDLNECIGQDVALVWNGEGLPPVGCECEYSLNAGKTWWKCKIDYIVGTQGVVMLCDTFEGVQYVQFSSYGSALKFRPIRSEDDKNRDEAKHTIAELCRQAASNGHAADLIYDAIADGKVRGVKLEG